MNSIHISFRGKYGLSNRIRSMAGHYALSKIQNLTASFEWHYDDSCPGIFDEVFQEIPEFSFTKPDHSEDYLTNRFDIYVSSATKPTTCGSHPDAIFDSYLKNDTSDRVVFDNFVSEFYSILKPSNFVLEAIQGLLSQVTVKVLGVHIRRTDMIDHSIKLGIEPPNDEILLNEVKDYLKNNDVEKIYVAADNPKSIELMESEFPGLIISQNSEWIMSNGQLVNDSKIQARLTSLTQAVSDVYLLSRCNYIIGTKLSSFSTFASTWGNTPYKRV